MTNCKKLLAIIVALVMLVSTLVSGLVVSAANPLGTLKVEGTTVDKGKDATVTFNLDLGKNSVDALHMFVTIASDVAITDAEIGEVAYVSTENFPAEDDELLDEVTNPRLKISTKELAQGKLLFESGVATVAKVTDVEFTVTFATAELDAGAYDFNVTVDATDYDEADYDVITLESAITVCGAEEPKPDCDHDEAAEVIEAVPATETKEGSIKYICADCGENVTAAVSYYMYYCTNAASASYESEVLLNFKARTDFLGKQGDYKDIKVVLSKADVEKGEVVYVYDDAEATPSSSDGKNYIGWSVGVAAKQLNDVVTSHTYVKCGDVWYNGLTITQSVVDYALGVLPDTDEKHKSVIANLLNYGSKAQIAFEYDQGNLAISHMPAEYNSYIKTEIPTATDNISNPYDVNTDKIIFTGVSLSAKARVEINYVFDTRFYTGNIDDITAVATVLDKNGNPVDVTFVSENVATPEQIEKGYYFYANGTNKYKFAYAELAASEMRKIVMLKAYQGETQVSCDLEYSVETQVAQFMARGKNDAEMEMYYAMLHYGDAAKTKFG